MGRKPEYKISEEEQKLLNSTNYPEISEKDATEKTDEELALVWEDFYKAATEAYLGTFPILIGEKFTLEETKYGFKNIKNEQNRIVLQARKYEDLSWAFMAFYIGYCYRKNQEVKNR